MGDFQAPKLVYLFWVLEHIWMTLRKPIINSSILQVYIGGLHYFYMVQNHEQSPQAAAHHRRSRQLTVSSSGSSELPPRGRGQEQPHLRSREDQLQLRGRPDEESGFRGRVAEEVNVRRAKSVSSLLMAAARPGFESLAGQGRPGESGMCRLQRDSIPFKDTFS